MLALRRVLGRVHPASFQPHAFFGAKSATRGSTGEKSSSATKSQSKPLTHEPRELAAPSSSRGLDVLQGLSLHAAPHSQRVGIDAIGPTSFTVNGVRVRGSLLLLPHLATFWNVEQVSDVCPAAFTLVKMHHPRPDMLLLGTGASVQPISRELYAFFSDLNVRFDVLDTKNASQTFNVLNQEGRLVAAALLPTSFVPPTRNSKN